MEAHESPSDLAECAACRKAVKMGMTAERAAELHKTICDYQKMRDEIDKHIVEILVRYR